MSDTCRSKSRFSSTFEYLFARATTPGPNDLRRGTFIINFAFGIIILIILLNNEESNNNSDKSCSNKRATDENDSTVDLFQLICFVSNIVSILKNICKTPSTCQVLNIYQLSISRTYKLQSRDQPRNWSELSRSTTARIFQDWPIFSRSEISTVTEILRTAWKIHPRTSPTYVHTRYDDPDFDNKIKRLLVGGRQNSGERLMVSTAEKAHSLLFRHITRRLCRSVLNDVVQLWLATQTSTSNNFRFAAIPELRAVQTKREREREREREEEGLSEYSFPNSRIHDYMYNQRIKNDTRVCVLTFILPGCYSVR